MHALFKPGVTNIAQFICIFCCEYKAIRIINGFILKNWMIDYGGNIFYRERLGDDLSEGVVPYEGMTNHRE